MKQRIYLLFTLLVSAWLSASAYDFMVNGIAYNKNNDGKSVTVTYTQYNSSSNYNGGCGSLVIPESVTYSGKTYYVTSIGDDAFAYCSGFTGSLTIPNSVTSIGNAAFYFCSGFTGSLNIPNSVTTIGRSAFLFCSGFTGSLTIGNSVTSIGNAAFYDCSGFTGSLIIPNSVTSIGAHAFYLCFGFTSSLTIPNSVTSIGDEAFAFCGGIYMVKATNTKPVNVGKTAFDYMGAILHVPTGCVDIYRNATGWSAFTQITDKDVTIFTYDNLQYTINVDGNTATLAGLVDRNSLSDLVIPNNAYYNGKNYQVTNIRDFAFLNCKNITGSLTIGNSVTSIGKSAFEGCRGFTGSLIIPNSVTSIGESAFDFCSGFNGSLTIPNSVTSIGSSAFSYCSGFTGSLIIPNSVTSIGESAFSHCSGFTGSLTIPNSVTSIENGAFTGCSGFTGSLTIPNSVTSIESSAFNDCHGFTGSLTIPNSVTSIGSSAFSYCSGFTGSLIIPNSVKTIDNWAFWGCSGFNGSLTIPNSVTSIGNGAFTGCSDFTEIHSLNPQPPNAVYDSFSDDTYNNAILYVYDGNINGYATAECWNKFRNVKAFNQIYTTEQEFFGGETILVPVYMKNPIEVTGFQTDIILPEGLDFAVDEDGYPEIYLSDRKNRSHTLGTTAIGEKCQRLLSYSSTSKPYSGEDGELFFFKVKSSWNTPIGDNIITLTNTELALPDGTKSKKLDNKIILHCYYVPGDANHDKKVSVSDIIADARYILLQNPDPFHYKSANLNEDSEISVSDIVLTANVILGRHQVDDKRFKVQRMMGGDALSAYVVESRRDGSRTIAIALDNSNDFTAFQADLCLPEGMEIIDARLSDRAGRSHTVALNCIGGNTVRVLSYASDNAVFAGNSGNLLLIDVKGRGEIEMKNALFAEPNGCEHELDEITFSTELSGINDITVGNAPVNVYNTAGQLIRTNVNPETATQGLPAGFYLVGNKKVVVK